MQIICVMVDNVKTEFALMAVLKYNEQKPPLCLYFETVQEISISSGTMPIIYLLSRNSHCCEIRSILSQKVEDNNISLQTMHIIVSYCSSRIHFDLFLLVVWQFLR